MARYIDADKLIAEMEENIKTYWNEGSGGYYLAEDALNYSVKTAATADVAPKSEVEMLQAEAECLRNANADLALSLLYECEPTKEHLHVLEATVREKVAREIFEEIEEKGKVDEPIVEYYILSYSELAELKKKHTESEKDNDTH